MSRSLCPVRELRRIVRNIFNFLRRGTFMVSGDFEHIHRRAQETGWQGDARGRGDLTETGRVSDDTRMSTS